MGESARGGVEGKSVVSQVVYRNTGTLVQLREREPVKLTVVPAAPGIGKQDGYDELWAIIGPHCGGEYEDPVRVALGSLIVGPHPLAIAALTGVPRYRVMQYGRILLDNGIWTVDEKLDISFVEEEPEDLLWIIELLLMGLCAEGLVVRGEMEGRVSKRIAGACESCGGTRSPTSGRFCGSCFRARVRILNS